MGEGGAPGPCLGETAEKGVVMSNKFDELLTDLGTGRWSYIYFLITGYHFFWFPTALYNATLIVPQMEYSCRHTGNNTEFSEDSCFYYINSTSNIQEHSCTSWIYDNSTFTSTLTSEFDLVCENYNFRAYYTSAVMFGTLIGCPIAGVLGDRYGGKMVVMAAALTYCTGSILMTLLPSLTGILLSRALIGLARVPNHYVLMMEVCEPKWRSLMGILLCLPWGFGVMTLGALGYLLRSWRDLQLAISIPLLLLIPIIWFSDESPRWLILNGRHGEALRVLRRAARMNKSTLPDDKQLLEMMIHIQKEGEISDSSMSTSTSYEPGRVSNESTQNNTLKATLKGSCLVCSSWIVGKITTICFIDFFVASFIFYGLSINGSGYSDDPFIYMCLTGLAETPAYIFGSPIVSIFGRRIPTSICYLMSGAALIVLAFIPAGSSSLVMGLALLGKLCITAAFQMMFLYITELFPTIMRQQGMGYSSVGAMTGSFISPLITELLSRVVSWGPAVVFGGSSLFAGLITLLLHETNKLPLPDTIQDLKEIKIHQNITRKDHKNASFAEKKLLES